MVSAMIDATAVDRDAAEESPASDVAAISVRGLGKRYGEIEAVRGVSFEVAAGETFGFLGPNGAGKSTTIKMLCTLTAPTAGAATVAGRDVKTERDAVRQNIGLVFQETTLDDYLTAEENLRFHAELYAVPKAIVAERIRAVLEMVDLWDRRGGLVRTTPRHEVVDAGGSSGWPIPPSAEPTTRPLGAARSRDRGQARGGG